ncbi:hypothetical protein [Pelomonas sp. Root1444]|uniref:hypothetical protein n=1 Tax=Pelomonas sp. Root1444 TaxID=1736464 RepID=UPI0012F7594B|nr:hypothetical protein [Pelomonas sp. Root1444]
MKRSAWLGVVVGWLVQLGLKTFLPVVVLVAMRFLSLSSGDKVEWVEHPDNTSHWAWYVIQGSVFLGSILAGMLAGYLSPRRSMVVPILLAVLSLLATAFEQFPRPWSPLVAGIWAGGPCLGLLIGYLVSHVYGREDA